MTRINPEELTDIAFQDFSIDGTNCSQVIFPAVPGGNTGASPEKSKIVRQKYSRAKLKRKGLRIADCILPVLICG